MKHEQKKHNGKIICMCVKRSNLQHIIHSHMQTCYVLDRCNVWLLSIRMYKYTYCETRAQKTKKYIQDSCANCTLRTVIHKHMLQIIETKNMSPEPITFDRAQRLISTMCNPMPHVPNRSIKRLHEDRRQTSDHCLIIPIR